MCKSKSADRHSADTRARAYLRDKREVLGVPKIHMRYGAESADDSECSPCVRGEDRREEYVVDTPADVCWGWSELRALVGLSLELTGYLRG